MPNIYVKCHFVVKLLFEHKTHTADQLHYTAAKAVGNK